METHLKSVAVIGSSAGGPRILKRLFDGLPLLRGSIVLVQHMPKFVNASFCEKLDALTDMTVRIAQDGDVLEGGNVYVAPSELHLCLVGNRRIRLFEGEAVHSVCPSVDVAMKSLKPEPGMTCIGVVLTGMGRDGAEGISHVKEIDGITIAQDEATSIIYGMPKEALKTGAVDWVFAPEAIREKFIELMGVMGAKGL